MSEVQEVEQVGALQTITTDSDFVAKVKLSKQFPRDMKRALENALTELDLDPALACRAYYSIPYKQWNAKTSTEETVFVEGPSINAAMSLMGHWGNCANGIRVVGQDDERIIVEGVFHDYERNVTTVRQQAVSRLRYDKKNAKMVPLREDRIVMAVQAGGSKAVRNCIIKGIPAVIVERYMQKAKLLASGVTKGTKLTAKDLKVRLEKMAAAFSEFGVTGEQLAAYMKANLAAQGTNEEKIAHMTGIYNSIKDGMANASEVFAVAEAPAQGQETRATGAKGSVKMEDLLAKKKAEEAPLPETKAVWPGGEDPEQAEFS